MEEKIKLEPFHRFFSDYGKTAEISVVSIPACSKLCRKYADFGVEGYLLSDWSGSAYLNYYLDFSLRKAPMLIFKRYYFIPLVFRQSESIEQLFSEDSRMQAFFHLLDWLLKNQPEKAIIDYHKPEKHHHKKMYVDSSFVAFRLSEILDVAGFPLSQFQTMDEFIEWNRYFHLIDNGHMGRHSKIFSLNDPAQKSELKMILKIVKLQYPETVLAIKEEKVKRSGNPLRRAYQAQTRQQFRQNS